MPKKYSAFTLVELLIVMGILIILLTVGVTIGRYIILKAQDTHHKDAARTLYSTLLKYKQDNGKYPELGECGGCIEREMFAYSLGYNGLPSDHILKPYMEEEGGFDGGSNATYYYATDEYDQQFVLVCVSLGGIDDESERGFYCTGSGIGLLPEHNPIPRNDIGSEESGDPYAIVIKGSMDESDWRPKEGGFWLSN
jgi:type II secretory pathway pseudopilin PulG